MLSGATRSKEHQRGFLTSDRGLKREEEKEGQEEERVLPAALAQPGEYLDRFWDEDRMVEEKRKKNGSWSRDASHSAAGRGTSREESKATSGVAQEGWLLSWAGPEGDFGCSRCFSGSFSGPVRTAQKPRMASGLVRCCSRWRDVAAVVRAGSGAAALGLADAAVGSSERLAALLVRFSPCKAVLGA